MAKASNDAKNDEDGGFGAAMNMLSNASGSVLNMAPLLDKMDKLQKEADRAVQAMTQGKDQAEVSLSQTQSSQEFIDSLHKRYNPIIREMRNMPKPIICKLNGVAAGAGCSLALASDFNPGSTPSGNLSFVWSLACVKMKMTPEEALNALTINAAYAMDLSPTHGSISLGKTTPIIITEVIPNLAYIPYSFGDQLVYKMIS